MTLGVEGRPFPPSTVGVSQSESSSSQTLSSSSAVPRPLGCGFPFVEEEHIDERVFRFLVGSKKQLCLMSHFFKYHNAMQC